MAGSNYTPPKLYDTTVPDLFVQIARENPQRNMVKIIREHPSTTTDSILITWDTFIQQAQNAATNLRARWASTLKDEALKSRALQPRKHGAPLVVAGMLCANGYEYYVNMLACSLNRWTVLHISLKNSPTAIEHLLRTAKADILLIDSSGSRVFDETVPGLCVLPCTGLETSADGPASPVAPSTPDQVQLEIDLPAFYLHTSGSTGHPKLITWSHRFFLCGARSRFSEGSECIGLHLYCIPPLCHAMGMFTMVIFLTAHAYVVTFASSPIPKPASGAALLTYIPFIKGGIIAAPPSVLEELYTLGPDAVKTVVDGTSLVIFAGAPLKKAVGNALVTAGMKVVAGYGSTEIGPVTSLVPQEAEDWEYVEFKEGYDFQFIPVDKSSELRELIAAPAEFIPAVINHENPRGFVTNDIFVPHPSKSHLWKHHSRTGGVTVLSNGEKTNNRQIESLLLQNKHIRYVQVFGVGRPLNGVILQPSDLSQSASEFLSLIEPTINNANTTLPLHSRLVSELIIVASQNKPFAITDKSTVKTQETLDRYADEITRRYAMLEEGQEGTWVFNGSVANLHDVKEFLRTTVRALLDTDVPDTADLFENGLDSLLSIRLRTALLAVIKDTPTASQPIPQNIIYTYPCINRLADCLVSCASTDKPQHTRATRERILGSIAKYSSSFVPHRPGTKVVHGLVVALTGSTGSLGCSLLALLLERENISKIYLLNRKGSATQKERHTSGFQSRGLDSSLLEKKKSMITYLDVDLSRGDLGLPKEAYEELRDTVTHIIHSAWYLNFNLILESYERVHIAGVRHLIDLALSSPHPHTPRLIFLSSVAAAGAYRGSSHSGEQILVPEEPIDDPSIPLDQGYGQGKYVGERIVVAAVQAGLRATVVRIGQLSGVTTTGAWSLSEHIPIMIRSSIALGMIPSDLPPVRWVPSDIAASVIIKQIFGSTSNLEYFHVESPTATPWKSIAQAASDASPHRSLRFISLTAWLEHVAAQGVKAEKEVPAVRLLEFFHGMAQNNSAATLGWERSVQVAPELAVGPVTPELVKKYVAYRQSVI